MSINAKRNRKGHSLIELSIASGFFSMLIMLAAGWIHQSMKLHRAMKNRHEHQAAVLRLARDFRDDVQRSQAVTSVEPDCIELRKNDDEVLIYCFSENQVRREVRISSQSSRHQQYRLLERTQVVWEYQDDEQSVSMRLVRRCPSPDVLVPDTRVTTQLNRFVILGKSEESDD